MARSLTVKHEEAPTTSPLFTAFLLLALGWMAMSAAVSTGSDGPDIPAATLYAQ